MVGAVCGAPGPGDSTQILCSNFQTIFPHSSVNSFRAAQALFVAEVSMFLMYFVKLIKEGAQILSVGLEIILFKETD